MQCAINGRLAGQVRSIVRASVGYQLDEGGILILPEPRGRVGLCLSRSAQAGVPLSLGYASGYHSDRIPYHYKESCQVTAILDSQDLPRSTPVLDIDNTPFWVGGGNGGLMIHRCQACGYRVHPPTSFCPVLPEAVSGRGTIVSMTVNHKQWLPGLKVPYVVALVAIEEQHDIRLIANIQGVPVENVFIGQEVEVFFEQTADVWVPLFRPSES